MKYFKRLVFAVLLAVGAVFLVACGAKSDNGTYVFKPTKDEIKGIMPSEFQSLIGDNYTFTISITINDKKGEMKVDTNVAGQNVNQVIDLEVDQKAKTLVSENEYGKAEITYQVSGNVLTIKDVKNSLMGDTDMFKNYMKIAKFKKVK
jgi:possible lipoprotein